MLGRTYDEQICSIARALEVVGERWSLLIVRDALFAGSTRFGDFQRSLGIATNVLTARLDGFVESGIMCRDGRFDYVLTDKGRDLMPALLALTEWGDRWAAPDGPPIRYAHAECGGHVTDTVVCDACGRLPADAAVDARPGPGLSVVAR